MKDKKTRLPFGESMRILGKALKLNLKTKSAASVIVSILGFGAAFLPMLIAKVVQRFSDSVQVLYGQGREVLIEVLGVFAILSVMYIVQLLVKFLTNYFDKVDRFRIQRYMKEYILRCTCDVKYKYIENYDDFREKIRFIENNSSERVARSMQYIVIWLQNIITFISLLVVLIDVNVWIVVALMVTCIPAVILSYYQKDEEYRSKTLWTYDSLMACMYFFEATWPNSINEVRFFGFYPYLKSKYKESNGRYIRERNKLTRKHVLFNSLADIFRSGIYVVVLLIAGAKIFSDPAAGIGTFMLVFTLASQLQEVTANIFVRAALLLSDIVYMKDFFYLEELDYEKRTPTAKPYEKFDIAVENVSFAYPNTERIVLNDVSVRIKEGEKVAIIGENGSGKTTFVNLLCAMYEPKEGSVKIGGKNVHDELSRTRRTISAAFQDFAQYEATIRENITISAPHKTANDGELLTLSARTGAKKIIDEQENGLDEMIGSFSLHGNNLSGGQWQKLAITRCAYRDDAKIMILDEPTAALDPIAEADLYRNFAELTGDRTTILISHRLGITRLVDRILVFDNGRIVEDGDHDTLIKKNGLYAKMYEAQARWYDVTDLT